MLLHNRPYSKMAAILVFFCLLAIWPLLPRFKENNLLNFEFKSEATRAYLQVNKRTLKWRPFWNKVYRCYKKGMVIVTTSHVPPRVIDPLSHLLKDCLGYPPKNYLLASSYSSVLNKFTSFT